MWYFLKLCTTYSYLMGLKKRDVIIFFVVNIQLCPHQIAPPVKIMPRPFIHVCGIACDKVPMVKMNTLKDLIIISHSYCLLFHAKWRYVKHPISKLSPGIRMPIIISLILLFWHYLPHSTSAVTKKSVFNWIPNHFELFLVSLFHWLI